MGALVGRPAGGLAFPASAAQRCTAGPGNRPHPAHSGGIQELQGGLRHPLCPDRAHGRGVWSRRGRRPRPVGARGGWWLRGSGTGVACDAGGRQRRGPRRQQGCGIGGVLAAEHPVPEGEIEPEMLPVAAVVDGVVGGPDQPASEPVMGKSQGEVVRSQVVHDRPDRHRGEDGHQGDEVEGYHQHDRHQEQGLQQGFEGVEGEGGPGCGRP